MANLDFSNKRIIKQNQLGVPIGGKTILGQLTTYQDGTAKWTYAKDTNPIIAGPGDRSTFTLYKDSTGKWQWTPTTSTSVSNLASREGITPKQINDALYQDKAPANAVLNAGNVTNLGGLNEAKKLGVPGTTGKATLTGPLPSQVSGNFYGQNGATPEQTTDSTTAETDTDPFSTEKFTKNIKGISRNDFKTPRSGAPDGILIYPNDIGSTKQDVIKFSMVQYSPKEFNQTTFGFDARRKITDENTIGTVILPIPSNISDTNSAVWSGQDMDAAQAELARLALGTVTGGGAGFAEELGNIANKVAGQAGEVKTAAAAVLSGSAAGVAGLLTRTTGAVINSNLELLFQGPTLRPFNFTFKMSARSQREAETIIAILRFFKQGMSPIRSSSNLFLKSPHTFKISYMLRGRAGQEHPYIGKIKECALQNFTVNYTPEGQYATFNDGRLVSYEMQMQFQELEPVFNDDYPSDNDASIGY